jgi:hypothetical protein
MDKLIESNKLIADFMGYEGQHEDWCGNNILQEDSLTGEKQMFPFRPHECWNDLMPVVEKIESMGIHTCIESCGGHVCLIQQHPNDKDKFKLSAHSYSSKIEAVYKCVILFIGSKQNEGK